VLQEITYREAKFVAHTRRLILDFGRSFVGHVAVFTVLQDWLVQAVSP
jgi:hypothetical protein